GRLGGSRRGAGANVDEFGRERRDRGHGRKPYDRPHGRGRGRGGLGGASSHAARVPAHVDEAKDISSRVASLIIKLGEVNSPALVNNLDALSVVLEKDFVKHETTVLQTIRQCVLEMPWKVTVYATLAGLLNAKNSATGQKIVRLMHAVLGRALAEGRWTEAKVVLRFFAVLAATRAITAETLASLVDQLLQPLDDGTCPASAGAHTAAYLAMSTLLWAGRVLHTGAPDALTRQLQVVQRYVESQGTHGGPAATRLTTVLHDAAPSAPTVLVRLLWVLRSVAEDAWRVDALCAPYEVFDSAFAQATAHDLPRLSSPVAGQWAVVRGEFLRLSGDDKQQEQVEGEDDKKTAVRRYVIMDVISDTLEQLSGNRKDCARYVLQIHGLCTDGVCTALTAPPTQKDKDTDVIVAESPLVFEHMVGEALFSQLLQLPAAPRRTMYYAALAVELRKSEPHVMADVLGLLVARLVHRVAALDVEAIERLSDWLAIYVSNFGFAWDWSMWADVAKEEEGMPRRVFVRETLLKLLRLSYLDRLRATVPESLGALLPDRAPGHSFKFPVAAIDERTREVSVAMGRCLKNRGTAEQALGILEENYSQWTDVDAPRRKTLAREMLVQHVLLLGSKTLSHMLSAIEKFAPAIGRFAEDAEGKLAVAREAEVFWARHPQFLTLTVDKLVDYRVIDVITVVDMVFGGEHVGGWSSFYLWEMLRTVVAKLRLRAEHVQARIDASSTMDDEESAGSAVEALEASRVLLARELDEVVVAVVRHFVRLLSSTEGAAGDADRAWLMGRFKEFVRVHRALVVANAAMLESLVFNEAASEDARQVFAAVRCLAL
ncbi:Nuclear cap-binding protein subunit 1, partial [Coemansia sp. RSA 2603]